jgi:hypothetical protein
VQKSLLTSVLFARDPELKPTTSVHGKIAFLQIVGVTAAECNAATRWNSKGLHASCFVHSLLIHRHSIAVISNLLRTGSPNLICDLSRPVSS